ncbi:MAG: hypothetical protein RR202_13590 [Bacteroidales bacterium]
MSMVMFPFFLFPYFVLSEEVAIKIVPLVSEVLLVFLFTNIIVYRKDIYKSILRGFHPTWKRSFARDIHEFVRTTVFLNTLLCAHLILCAVLFLVAGKGFLNNEWVRSAGYIGILIVYLWEETKGYWMKDYWIRKKNNEACLTQRRTPLLK